MFGTINTLGILILFLGMPELISGIGLFGNLFPPEVILAAGGFIFNILALPTLLSKDAAIPKAQSIPSSLVLFFCFAIPYYIIGFQLSAVANTTGAVLWALIAAYRSPDEITGSNVKETSSTTSSNMAPADD